jgi:2'-phosphotransferase
MSSVEGQDVSALASTSQTKSAKPNGNKNNGKGGKGGPRQDAPPTVQLSKALSYILRHGAAKEGLKVRPDGYLSLTAVLARPKVSKLKMEHGGSPTEEDVLAVVNSNDKKRFEVKGGGKDEPEEQELLIRAVQGHSISEVSVTRTFVFAALPPDTNLFSPLRLPPWTMFL